MPQADHAGSEKAPSFAAPHVSLPKGGGAIRGMGEKFGANPVTGTGSMSFPIATGPGRAGFVPQLSLSYDSGAGNGPYCFGWSLSLPAITRKTDKGLPQYVGESDVFILSGAEDLVPVLDDSACRQRARRMVGGIAYTIERFRPRIEGLFARIERWTSTADAGEIFWRSISRDNVTSWYGKTAESRIADPDDPRRIFSWLICESHDDKGKAIAYSYKAEDGAGVDDCPMAHERNRSQAARTAQRYIKRIRYGNVRPYFPELLAKADAGVPTDWHFELVFDYGEHASDAPTPLPARHWPVRADPFSSYRAGFEVRTYRICQRILLFHHFPDEVEVGRDCLVQATALTSSADAVYSFLRAVTTTGYRRQGGSYVQRSLPPVEFTYAEPQVQETIEEVAPASLGNLPAGLSGAYRLTDLHGEGVPGILAEQGGAWFYNRNLSPLTNRAHFAGARPVIDKPNAELSDGAELMDLTGDGRPDLVLMNGPTPGLYQHDDEEGWQSFRPFSAHLNRDLADASVKLIDLDGDGYADVLISEDQALVWHSSRAANGFGPERRVAKALDEEQGPRIVFADAGQSIYLADMSGDGLTDIVRIRNGDVCYWPNLGYGRFGAKVAMDNAPWFDEVGQCDPRRLRLADIDGSGTTDLIYLHGDGVRLYFNQSGNAWSDARMLRVFPRVDELVSIVAADLLGNGTACLVWSSPLPADALQPMRYVNLMGGRKPHLLTVIDNNLGAETRIEYVPSTRFYLQDKCDGTPWLTRLAFPVQVVERVATYDHISRNRFVTRYAYHHGYYDSDEREFRGFGMVEQWDTEQFGTLAGAGNVAAASHVPPVHMKTWFHTGAEVAGLQNEYFREPGLDDDGARAQLMPDTVIPAGLDWDEEREARRSLKGSMLRREVYADDADACTATPEQIARARTPYTVTEQSFATRCLQRRGNNLHAVFLTHALETVTYHYERSPLDPRVEHTLTLEVNDFGNVLKQATAAYGRRSTLRIAARSGELDRVANPALAALSPADRAKQTTPLLSYTENRVTNAVETTNAWRTPLGCETRTFELTGYLPTGPAGRYRARDLVKPDATGHLRHLFKVPEVAYEDVASGERRRRPTECLRTLYRRDDLNGMLPLGELESMALPGDNYKLAFTPGLLARVYQRDAEDLLPDPVAVLGADGGYLHNDRLKADGWFPPSDPDGNWWLPSGRFYYAQGAENELAQARAHFFLPRRYQDPFGQDAFVDFDPYDLLMAESRDALGNRIRALVNDYRVLQARTVSDPNGNRSEVAFDALGMVVGSAIMGKPSPAPVEGDSLEGFRAELPQEELDTFFHAGDPHAHAAALLHQASTRILYDVQRFRRTRLAHPDDPARWQPAGAATLARETHAASATPIHELKIQLNFSWSDGFGREIQKKSQAEPGPLDVNDSNSPRLARRWVATGWTIFNNKGKPVRQYEPFFSARHDFEFGVIAGVSAVLFYDPAERVVATLHPDHTYDKVVFGPWHQTSHDVNDTCAARDGETGDPRTDADIHAFMAAFFREQGAEWETWHALRIRGALGEEERQAALRAQEHANTPATAHVDVLGRTFLTITRNRVRGDDGDERLATRVQLDIEGNKRVLTDAEGRTVMQHDFDMLGRRIHQVSMEAGARWMLDDVAGNLIRAWDSRGHNFTSRYDALRRPTEQSVRGTSAQSDPRTLDDDILVDRIDYGESLANAEALNLRTRIYRHFDSAGVAYNAALNEYGEPVQAWDFKGNLLCSTRRLTSDCTAIADWRHDPKLDDELFEGRTRYDALNRPVQSVPPHRSGAGRYNVIQRAFNEANLLERIDVWLARDSMPDALLDPVREAPSDRLGVASVDYDAKGQRLRIDYRNGASTHNAYDPLTFRLARRLTGREDGGAVQDLRYTYDPSGNITHIRDDVQQDVYFRNQRVDASNDYVYDALYRLIEASGREHLGQSAPSAPDAFDGLHLRLAHPADGKAMARYRERYAYDAVGNLLRLQHRGTDSAHAGWTREYAYHEASLTDGNGTASNRLSLTTLGDLQTDEFGHDCHGNMIRMPHLGGGDNLHWDYKDKLRQVDTAGGSTWYAYDASGQRVRKVCRKAQGMVEERIYLSGFEIFRQRTGSNAVTLERETLHLIDDKQRIAMVETRTLDIGGDDRAPQQLIRYQFDNHLGSSSIELDEQAKLISYEEYTPFGSTSFQSVRSDVETPKRYRFTARERDEESGLYYHGARYYIPWLGRWTSPDPAGVEAGINLYVYANNQPTRMVDTNGFQPEPAPNDDAPGSAARVGAAGVHAVTEGAIWNPTVYGTITRVERALINFRRGKILEAFLGNIRGLPGALGPTARDADRALRTTVQQIKTTYVDDVARVARNATAAAQRFIAANAGQAGKEAEAVINLATGTPRTTVAAARAAVAPVAGATAVPRVSVGLPGPLGTVLKFLAPVGAVLSAASLPNSIERGDVVGSLTDASGFVAGSLETGALALGYFGGSGATGGTALIGAGGTAGAGLATAGAVVGSFGVGLGIGRLLDWGTGEIMSATGAADAIDRSIGVSRGEGETGDYSISGMGAIAATEADQQATSLLRTVGVFDESQPAYTQTLGWRLAEVLPSWMQ